MRKICTILALLASSTAATASPSDELEDMRCFIVAAELANNDDKELEQAGSIMLFYFLGRLDARNPGADLEALIEQEAGNMTEAQKAQLFTSCAAQVEQQGKRLASMGDDS